MHSILKQIAQLYCDNSTSRHSNDCSNTHIGGKAFHTLSQLTLNSLGMNNYSDYWEKNQIKLIKQGYQIKEESIL